MMDTVEKIAMVIPKLKYQLIFLKERELLMRMVADRSLNVTYPLTVSLSISIESTSSAQETFDQDHYRQHRTNHGDDDEP